MENKSTMNPDKIKHLEFIQGVITRMGANSFQMKGWAVTIYAALLALYAGSSGCSRNTFLFVAAISTLIFWLLDTYYLQQERKFRGIYNDVAGLTGQDQQIEVRLFEMPIQKYNCKKDKKYSYWNVFISMTIWLLYVPMIVAAVIGGIFLGR